MSDEDRRIHGCLDGLNCATDVILKANRFWRRAVLSMTRQVNRYCVVAACGEPLYYPVPAPGVVP
jgi:hypothetical protein